MKIKKLKIKLNKDNEYSDYRYFIPKSNNIKMTDGRDADEAVQSLKDKIANLKEQANYLINKAPLVKYVEGSSITTADSAEAQLRKITVVGDTYQEKRNGYNYIKQFYDIQQSYVSWIVDPALITNTMFFSVVANATLENTNTLYFQYFEESDTEMQALSLGNWNYSANKKTVIPITLTDEQVTLLNSCYQVRIQIYENRAMSGLDYTTMTFTKAMLSDSDSYPYEVYGATPSLKFPSKIININEDFDINITNENLLPFNVQDVTRYGIRFTKNSNNTLTLNGTATGSFQFNIATDFYLPKEDCFFSVQETGEIINNGNSSSYSLRNAEHIQCIGNNRIGAPTNRIISADLLGNIMHFFALWITKDSVFKNFTIALKIEKGKKATAYQPHRSQQIIFPLTENQKMYRDSYLTDLGICHHRKQVKMSDLTWGISRVFDKAYSYYAALRDRKYINNIKIISSHYPYWGTISAADLVENCKFGLVAYYHEAVVDSGRYIYLKSNLATIEELQQQLNENEAILEYELKEPIIDPYTVEQQAVYNKIKEMQSYYGITHFTTSTIQNQAVANIKLVYKQDINAILEEKGV